MNQAEKSKFLYTEKETKQTNEKHTLSGTELNVKQPVDTRELWSSWLTDVFYH